VSSIAVVEELQNGEDTKTVVEELQNGEDTKKDKCLSLLYCPPL